MADGLSYHDVASVQDTIEATGAMYWPLPPSSPDSSPIEQCGSRVKGAIRAAAPRTLATAYDTIERALGAVTRRDIGYFEHAGDVPPGPIGRRLRSGAR